MKRLPVPVPGLDTVGGLVGRVVTGVADTAEQARALVPRAWGLLDEAGRVLAEVHELVLRIEGTRALAQETVRRADAVVTRADAVLVSAQRLVGEVEPLVARLRPLLDELEPPLRALQPTLERLAEATDPREVDAMIAMVDRMPLLADKLENDVIPMLQGLATVAPDLHDLLDVSREVNVLLGAVPGFGRLRKRIDEVQAIEGRG